jgi:hypothetical protein
MERCNASGSERECYSGADDADGQCPSFTNIVTSQRANGKSQTGRAGGDYQIQVSSNRRQHWLTVTICEQNA